MPDNAANIISRGDFIAPKSMSTLFVIDKNKFNKYNLFVLRTKRLYFNKSYLYIAYSRLVVTLDNLYNIMLMSLGH